MKPKTSDNVLKVKNCQFGCGALIVDNYVNVDFLDHGLDEAVDYGVLWHIGNKGANCYFLKQDVTGGIQLPENHYEHVYHSHFLEHLSNTQGLTFLQNCHRILKSGGKMRIVVPDLEYWSDAYINNRKPFLDWYKNTWLPDNPLYQTRAQIFMGALHNHGHRMGYDFETLQHVLTHIGFVDVQRSRYGESDFPEIKTLEKPDSKSMESICVECKKP